MFHTARTLCETRVTLVFELKEYGNDTEQSDHCLEMDSLGPRSITRIVVGMDTCKCYWPLWPELRNG